MAINFENKESRLEYLSLKLDDLLDSINSSYGKTLLNELVTRLQRTIEDFNEEFQGIMGELKDSSERRHQILHDLMEGNTISKRMVKKPDIGEDDIPRSETNEETPSAEMSEWEKKLEGLA